jgi:DNA-binding CsgD family transcriptional regulator
MQILNSRGMTGITTGTPKNCHRCGTDFVDYSDGGLARVCVTCKAPKPPQSRFDAVVLAGKALTPREVQIATGVAHGLPNKEIAYQLHLGEGTIKTFLSTILAKTGMPNRTTLAVWWALSHRKEFPAIPARRAPNPHRQPADAI